jgi:integrase
MSENSNRPPQFVAYESGLKISGLGLNGLVTERTEHYHCSATRHQDLMVLVDSDTTLAPGAKLLLYLPINEFILSLTRLRAAVSHEAHVYKDRTNYFLEFCVQGGWKDRRELSLKTAQSIEENKGCRVRSTDWRSAANFLSKLRPELSSRFIWQGFLDDAKCWCFQNLPGPLFAHALGLAPFQMLPRAALARGATGLPQKSAATNSAVGESDDVDLVHSTFVYSDDLKIFDELVAFVGKVARDRLAKDTGRKRILDKIQLLLPIAADTGRGQLIVLGAIKHALHSGGVHGELWAPITLYEYLRQGVKDLARMLVQAKLDGMTGEDFHVEYTKLLLKIKESQRPKFEAFLLAFHRFMVISGFDPLPRALSGKQEPLPPSAATVTDQEVSLALEYIQEVAPNERIALQARLGLLLAFWIPIRTCELWCLRVGDVHIKSPMFLSIYPRLRDGVDKNEAMRHQEDIEAISSHMLKSLLIDMVNERKLRDFAADEDFLLGRAGYPGERHEQLLTTKLMNEALRWATGDDRASFYDLRHTAFSRRAQQALLEAIHGD